MTGHDKLHELQRAFLQVLQEKGPWILLVLLGVFALAALWDFGAH